MIYLHLLKQFIHNKIGLFILINFIFLITLIYYNFDIIKNSIKKVTFKSWILLFAIFSLGLLLRLFLAPHQHILYVDEPWYMKAGKNLHIMGYQGFYFKSIGWPFILSIVFGIFGVSNWVALYTSSILGALTIINIFLLGYFISKDERVGIVSALIFSLIPVHIRWSGSAETNVPSLFFVTLIIFFCFLYFEYKKYSLLWLSLFGIAFLSQFRLENYVFFIIFLMGIFIFSNRISNKISLRFIAPWITSIILSLPNLIGVLDYYLSINWIESDTRGVATGANFSISNLISNSKEWGVFIFNNKYHPYLFTVLFIIGIICFLRKKIKHALFLVVWFILIYVIYFGSWFQTVGGRERLFISFYPITIILASLGMFFISDLISRKCKFKFINKITFPFLTLVLIIMFVPYTITQSKTYRDSPHKLETKIPELAERDLPKDCIIIANWPAVLESTTHLRVIDINDFLKHPQFRQEIFSKSDCVLFYEDIFCLDYGDYCWQEKENWRKLKEMYAVEPYVEYREGSKRYVFYRLLEER